MRGNQFGPALPCSTSAQKFVSARRLLPHTASFRPPVFLWKSREKILAEPLLEPGEHVALAVVLNGANQTFGSRAYRPSMEPISEGSSGSRAAER
jgi:hypothetical protein